MLFTQYVYAESENIQQHNFIVIMTDDLSYSQMNHILEEGMMPNFQESVVDRGASFTNSFVTTPLCCPARATLFTGQYAHNHGVTTNSLLNLDDEHTIAVWLDNAGYDTGIIGKYLNGYGLETERTYVAPGWDSWQVLVLRNILAYNFDINHNGVIEQYGNSTSDYRTDVFAEFAKEFIHESSINENPFFLFISTRAPHTEGTGGLCSFNDSKTLGIILPPERYIGTTDHIMFPINPSFNETDVSDKPLWIQERESLTDENLECVNEVYQNGIASMRAVDDLVGVVNQALIDTNQRDKTVIIFTSDNGYLFGEHRIKNKGVVYEESIRVPLFISLPNQNSPITVNHLVTNNDLAPTIIELSGAESDVLMDGTSLIPLLEETNEEWRDKVFFETQREIIKSKAVRTTSQVYIENDDLLGFVNELFLSVFNKNNDAQNEFYDLKNDPFQLENLNGCIDLECIGKIATYKKWISEFENCTHEKCKFIESPDYKSQVSVKKLDNDTIEFIDEESLFRYITSLDSFSKREDKRYWHDVDYKLKSSYLDVLKLNCEGTDMDINNKLNEKCLNNSIILWSLNSHRFPL